MKPVLVKAGCLTHRAIKGDGAHGYYVESRISLTAAMLSDITLRARNVVEG